MLFVQLIRLDVRSLARYTAGDLVLLADDRRAGEELFEVIDNCVLDMDISLCEDVCAACAFTFLMRQKITNLSEVQ